MVFRQQSFASEILLIVIMQHERNTVCMSVNRGSDFIFPETYEKPYDENSVEESYEETFNENCVKKRKKSALTSKKLR